MTAPKRLADVAALVGVPATTLRSWERRYGWPSPVRSVGGHRRYSASEIRRVEALRDEIARGRSPREAVILLRRMERLSRSQFVTAVADGAATLDAAAVCYALDHAVARLGIVATIEGVVVPTARALGLDPHLQPLERQTTCVEGLHQWMVTRRSEREGSRPVVLSPGPDELHSIGVQALAVLLSHAGTACRVLAPHRSADGLVADIEGMEPQAVIVSCHRTLARIGAVDVLRRLAPADIPVFYCGNGFAPARSRRSVPGVYLGTNFREAASTVRASVAR